MGHSTYKMIMQTPAMQQAFSRIEKVLVSKNAIPEADCKIVSSPKEAVGYLKDKDFKTAILAGGLQTYNSFLSEGLVTDLYFSIVPVIISDGGIIAPQSETLLSFKLAGQSMLAEDIIQLHYTKE
ncbi:MAG: dihydrofolate reductase family protein [Tannerellaceae bacterium]|nr:dihydrofolate reductase family protein [Tannerellaceae bacterium]